MPRTRRRDSGATPPPPSGSTLAGARRLRENLPRPAPVANGTAASPAGPRQPAPARRRSPFAFLGKLQPRFAADIFAELRKVTWPTFQETRYLTVVVAIVALAVGMVLGGVDLAFGWIIEKLFF